MSPSAAGKVKECNDRSGELRRMRTGRRHSFAVAASAAGSVSSTSRGSPVERLDRLIRGQQQRTNVSPPGHISNAAVRPGSSKATCTVDLAQGDDEEGGQGRPRHLAGGCGSTPSLFKRNSSALTVSNRSRLKSRSTS